MGKYLKVFAISIKNSTTYMRDFIIGNTFIIIIIFVFIQLWKNLYAQNIETGFTFQQLIWYLIINQVVFSNNMEIFRRIEDDIKTGSIAYYLNKPYSYPVFIAFEALGKIIVRLAVNMVFGILLGLGFVGSIPAFSLINLLPMVIMITLAIVLNLLIYILLALTSFWLEENRPFALIYRQLVFAFGGFLIPLTLFPQALYNIMRHMPWTYIAFHTSRTIVLFEPAAFINTAAWQIFYIALFSLLIFFVYRKGADALNVNGG
jgi:ABC-2 type transport system permease protein